jgi:hypothetical protein
MSFLEQTPTSKFAGGSFFRNQMTAAAEDSADAEQKVML